MLDFWIQLDDWLNYGWDIGAWGVTVGMLLGAALIAALAFVVRRMVTGNLLHYFKRKGHLQEAHGRKLRSIINLTVLLLAAIGIVKVLGLDWVLYDQMIETTDKKGNPDLQRIIIRITTLLFIATVFIVAQLADWILARILFDQYYNQNMAVDAQDAQKEKRNTHSVLQYLFYLLAGIVALRAFGLDYHIKSLKDGGHFTVSNILEAISVLLLGWLLVWVVTRIILPPYYKRKTVDVGNQFAVNQLLKYFIFTVTTLFVLQNSLHFNLTILLGGAAALLVGVGLGLQQTFNDLVSGLILLFERTVEVGDVVQVDGLIGTVTSIGIRTSVVLVRDNTSVVVPNSKFITENVVNWTLHETKQVRFHVPVGVAYGSDTELVKQTLLDVAEDNPDVLQRPAPFVRFVDFGDSSLDFELHFWSRNFIRIEDVKSDIRFQVDAAFRTKGIEIPFPQRVIWKGGE